MKGWYNNTLDDVVAGSLSAAKADIDWMVRNRMAASDRDVNYTSLYMTRSLYSNPNFLETMKYAAGKNILFGAAYSDKTKVDSVLAHNASKSDPAQQFKFMVTEYEPYQTGMSYSYLTDLMTYAYPKLRAAGLKHVVYMGWPTETYWQTIVDNCDEINLHIYRNDVQMTESAMWSYATANNRLGAIAAAAKRRGVKMKVNPIYSCEPDFADQWFKSRPWWEAQRVFMRAWDRWATKDMGTWLTATDGYMFVTKEGKKVKP